MEKKWKQRMFGEDSEDDSVESDEEAGKLTKREKKKRRREISGDDLGENFVLDDDDKKGTGWLDDVMARRDDQEADSDEEEGSDEAEDGSDEVDEEDNEDEERDSQEEENEEETRETRELLEKVRIALEKKKKREEDRAIAAAKRAVEAQQELEALPFVVDAPQTLGDFRVLVDRRTNEELVLAIQRIRTCNAISFAADNRKNMQIFYNVLLQHFGTLAMEKPFLLSPSLTKPLIELSTETPYFAATCARQRLDRMHTQITEGQSFRW